MKRLCIPIASIAFKISELKLNSKTFDNDLNTAYGNDTSCIYICIYFIYTSIYIYIYYIYIRLDVCHLLQKLISEVFKLNSYQNMNSPKIIFHVVS